MTTDVMARLRAADPVPQPAAYDDAVAQRNIDAITRADVTVGAPAFAIRSRPRPRWAVAAVAVALAAVGTLVGVEIHRDGVAQRADGNGPAGSAPAPSSAGWTTTSANGVTFDHPAAWTSYPTGPPSTMSWAVAYLSTEPFGPVCGGFTDDAGNAATECHPPQPDLSAGGVLVDWTFVTSPGGLSLDGYPGSPTTLAGRDARLDRSPQRLPAECGPTRAVAAVTAAIASASNNVLTMTACLGPGDLDAARAAVDRMLASLRIDR